MPNIQLKSNDQLDLQSLNDEDSGNLASCDQDDIITLNDNLC